MMFPSGGVNTNTNTNTKDWMLDGFGDEGFSMGCCGYLFVGVKAVTYFMRLSQGRGTAAVQGVSEPHTHPGAPLDRPPLWQTPTIITAHAF